MLEHSSANLARAILQTVAYSDIFDYPLTARELHRYLTGVHVSLEEVVQAVEKEDIVARTGDYFTLPGREEIVRIRMQREAHSRELMPRAIQYGRVLGTLPYIRMVALTGSLAVMNVSKDQDFDYMLVTAPGRLWTARAFALAFNRFTRLQGYTLCPNLIVSETTLEWRLHDLYSAHELYQMIPISGMNVYSKLIKANEWAKKFLPNGWQTSEAPKNGETSGVSLLKFLELPLQGKLGDQFEKWEMNRKIARFSKQPGFGEETIFNAEVCQGNFHHHRKWTYTAFEEKLNALAAVPDGEMALTQSPRTAIGANRL